MAAVFLSLCGCGQTKAAADAQKAIDAIGTVTLDSGEAIQYAEKLYGILTDKEKESIDNRIILVDAREAFDRLVAEAEEAAQAAAAAAEEAARLAKIEASVPAMDEFVKAANSIIWNFEFAAKYAGNVNGNASGK